MVQIARGNEQRIDDATLRVTRTSCFTGAVHVADLPITDAQWRAWRGGELIQNAMPGLSAQQREFLMTGTTRGEWDAEFGGDDEEADGEK